MTKVEQEITLVECIKSLHLRALLGSFQQAAVSAGNVYYVKIALSALSTE